jgi:hypothetical protein
MGRTYPQIDDALGAWIAAQPLFFVATSPLSAQGHVNVSPKGPIGTLQIVSPTEVAYLDCVGSGAETAAHLQENGRIVLMLCAFQGPPRVLRLHGRGEVVWMEDPAFGPLLASLRFVEPGHPEARRAIIRVKLDRISDSCGYGVPLMSYAGERPQADAWAKGKLDKGGPDALQSYKQEKNRRSVDGLPAWPPPGRG